MNNTNKFRHFDENFSLSGKTAIVTGAASGIGIEIARMFARKGADLIAVDLHISSHLESYVHELGRQCLSIAGDLSEPNVISDIITKTMKTFNKIDILVNCAGVGILEPVAETTDKVWYSGSVVKTKI